MKRVTSYLAVCACAALFGFGLATTANGQTGEASQFSLTEPLDVGNTVLEPGTYQIMVVPQRWNRNLLQVRTPDGMKLFATLLSVPHPEGPSGVQIPESRYVYYPPVAGHIRALRTWYAANTPGSGGHDIVYSRERAIEYAALVKEPVVATQDEVQVADYETAPLVVVTPDKVVKPFAPAPEPPVKVAEAPVTHKRLPGTASNVPLAAGLGLVSLIGALGLGVLARRVS